MLRVPAELIWGVVIANISLHAFVLRCMLCWAVVVLSADPVLKVCFGKYLRFCAVLYAVLPCLQILYNDCQFHDLAERGAGHMLCCAALHAVLCCMLCCAVVALAACPVL
jgi:hypothetical protein